MIWNMQKVCINAFVADLTCGFTWISCSELKTQSEAKCVLYKEKRMHGDKKYLAMRVQCDA